MIFEVGQRVTFRSLQWEVEQVGSHLLTLFGRDRANQGRRARVVLGLERIEHAEVPPLRWTAGVEVEAGDLAGGRGRRGGRGRVEGLEGRQARRAQPHKRLYASARSPGEGVVSKATSDASSEGLASRADEHEGARRAPRCTRPASTWPAALALKRGKAEICDLACVRLGKHGYFVVAYPWPHCGLNWDTKTSPDVSSRRLPAAPSRSQKWLR